MGIFHDINHPAMGVPLLRQVVIFDPDSAKQHVEAEAVQTSRCQRQTYSNNWRMMLKLLFIYIYIYIYIYI